LSVKTLRHYHEVGLLAPAAVNPGTGYRYYSAEQIPAAQVIRRLRDLEMPVGEVKAVLAAGDAADRNVLIAAHLDRLEAGLAQTRAAVDSLRNLLQPPPGAPAIEHRSVPAVRAAGIVAVADHGDVLAWWQGALGELRATVRAQGLRVTGPPGGMFASELFQHEHGEATVFVPVEGSVRSIGRVTPVTVPAAELAVISHLGSLSDADLSYATLGSYATRHEISVDGPLREYYLRGAGEVADEAEWRTEIGWPIFRADGPRETGADRPRGADG
jgi:DNA-binding transcriptional MerR regulator/effector-binding domain-containing protein